MRQIFYEIYESNHSSRYSLHARYAICHLSRGTQYFSICTNVLSTTGKHKRLSSKHRTVRNFPRSPGGPINTPTCHKIIMVKLLKLLVFLPKVASCILLLKIEMTIYVCFHWTSQGIERRFMSTEDVLGHQAAHQVIRRRIWSVGS